MSENEEWFGEYVLLQNGQMVGPMLRYSRTYWIALDRVDGRRQHLLMPDGSNDAHYYTVWLSKGVSTENTTREIMTSLALQSSGPMNE
jgi:hypothetical protein